MGSTSKSDLVVSLHHNDTFNAIVDPASSPTGRIYIAGLYIAWYSLSCYYPTVYFSSFHYIRLERRYSSLHSNLCCVCFVNSSYHLNLNIFSGSFCYNFRSILLAMNTNTADGSKVFEEACTKLLVIIKNLLIRSPGFSNDDEPASIASRMVMNTLYRAIFNPAEWAYTPQVDALMEKASSPVCIRCLCEGTIRRQRNTGRRQVSCTYGQDIDYAHETEQTL